MENKLVELKADDLPHGSGIDADYCIEYKKNRIVVYNSYHYMNEMGFYMGWIDFKLSIPRDKPRDFKLSFQTNSTGYYWVNSIMLREYLEELYAYAIDELIKEE